MARAPRRLAAATAGSALPPRRPPADPAKTLPPPRQPAAVLTLAFAVTTAILPNVVSWKMETQGVVLLVLTALSAYALIKIPHKSYHWNVAPGTDFARLKQMVATLRTIVSVLLAVLVLAILFTSQSILGRLPDEISKIVAPAISEPNQPDVLALRLESAARPGDGTTMFLGRVEDRAPARDNGPTEAAATGKERTGAEAQSGTVIYVVAAPTIMRRLLERSLLPSFFEYAWMMLILCGLFISGVYGMELMGNINWEQRNARAADSA